MEGLSISAQSALYRTPRLCPNPYEGSAHIISDRDLAVVVTQEDVLNTRASQYNAFSSGGYLVYIPSVMRDWYDWTSSFTVQNLSDQYSTGILVQYRARVGDDSSCILTGLAPRRSCVVVQDQSQPSNNACQVEAGDDCSVDPDWEGSVILTPIDYQPIVAVVNQELRANGSGDSRHQSYSAFVHGGNYLYAPFAAQEYHPDPAPPPSDHYIYRSSSHVQNLSEYDSIDITTVGGYYWPDGTAVANAGRTAQADVWEPVMFYLPDPAEGVPDEFIGSVRAEYTPHTYDGIAGIHNYARAIDGDEEHDFGASYNMPQRTDTLAPTSQVEALSTYNPARFQVAWSGEDDLSGIASYDVQLCTVDCDSPNLGGWTDWLVQTTLTASLFTGDHGVNYAFRCRARDHVGNVEPYPSEPDTATTVDTQPPDTAVEAMALYTTSASFPVRWDGSDDLSGLDHYDIYVRDESAGGWQPWIEGTTINQAIFSGNAGHTYHGKKPRMIQALPSVSHQA